jgi:ribonuclease T1
MRNPVLLIIAVVLLVAGLWGVRTTQSTHADFAPPSTPAASTAAAANTTLARPHAASNAHSLPAFLPPEAHNTIELIQRGGPFPYRHDGSVFGNRERLLPQRPRGYYHEYTVDTPGASSRGARRIVTGGTPPDIWYYSDDHYQSFKSFSLQSQGAAR